VGVVLLLGLLLTGRRPDLSAMESPEEPHTDRV
jgi:hypothetical protein